MNVRKDYADAYASILKQYSEGVPLVRKTLTEDYWHDVEPNEHNFDFNRYVYARKMDDTKTAPNVPRSMIAKSEYRPYETYEVLDELDRHGWKVCYHNAVYYVQSVDSYGKIWIGDKWHKNPIQGFEELTWYDDHTPYGALKNTL